LYSEKILWKIITKTSEDVFSVSGINNKPIILKIKRFLRESIQKKTCPADYRDPAGQENN